MIDIIKIIAVVTSLVIVSFNVELLREITLVLFLVFLFEAIILTLDYKEK